jgi:hypothetical protein
MAITGDSFQSLAYVLGLGMVPANRESLQMRLVDSGSDRRR